MASAAVIIWHPAPLDLDARLVRRECCELDLLFRIDEEGEDHGEIYSDAGFAGSCKRSQNVKNGRVEQTNFDTYRMLRMNEAPAIEVHVVKSTAPPGGLGETGTSAIVPAIANAIFAATGKRLRKMPVDAGALKQPA
jgi:hypothetical protein